MWVSEVKSNCGCWKPTPYEEYELPKVVYPILPKLELPLSEEEPCLGELKDKIINEYKDILDSLECGIQPPLEFLLDEITFVEVYKDLEDKPRTFLLQHYLNNENNKVLDYPY